MLTGALAPQVGGGAGDRHRQRGGQIAAHDSRRIDPCRSLAS